MTFSIEFEGEEYGITLGETAIVTGGDEFSREIIGFFCDEFTRDFSPALGSLPHYVATSVAEILGAVVTLPPPENPLGPEVIC